MIGPKQVANPKTPIAMPKYIERLSSNAIKPTTPSAPWIILAVPTPAMARSTMNTGELIHPAACHMKYSAGPVHSISAWSYPEHQDPDSIYNVQLERHLKIAKNGQRTGHCEWIGRAILAAISQNLVYRCDFWDYRPTTVFSMATSRVPRRRATRMMYNLQPDG